jgi:hypothetical protein
MRLIVLGVAPILTAKRVADRQPDQYIVWRSEIGVDS